MCTPRGSDLYLKYSLNTRPHTSGIPEPLLKFYSPRVPSSTVDGGKLRFQVYSQSWLLDPGMEGSNPVPMHWKGSAATAGGNHKEKSQPGWTGSRRKKTAMSNWSSTRPPYVTEPNVPVLVTSVTDPTPPPALNKCTLLRLTWRNSIILPDNIPYAPPVCVRLAIVW